MNWMDELQIAPTGLFGLSSNYPKLIVLFLFPLKNHLCRLLCSAHSEVEEKRNLHKYLWNYEKLNVIKMFIKKLVSFLLFFFIPKFQPISQFRHFHFGHYSSIFQSNDGGIDLLPIAFKRSNERRPKWQQIY